MLGRVLATAVLLILCAACAGEPAPARPVIVDVPRLASDPTPRTDREQAAPYPEPASDPAPVRSRPSDPTMASCLAEPLRIADQRYSEIPFTTTQRIQLRRLLAGVEGQCMMVNPDAWFWNRRPFAIPPARCKAEIGRIYAESHRWIDAAHWFRRTIFEHSGDDGALDDVRSYVYALRRLAENSDPPRPSCHDVLRADLDPIACMLCQGGKNADFCLGLRRYRFDFTYLNATQVPSRRRGPCPNTHAFTWWGGCKPLPPIVPVNCL